MKNTMNYLFIVIVVTQPILVRALQYQTSNNINFLNHLYSYFKAKQKLIAVDILTDYRKIWQTCNIQTGENTKQI